MIGDDKQDLETIEEKIQMLDSRPIEENPPPRGRSFSLSAKDMGTCLRVLGLAPTEKKLKKLMEQYGEGARLTSKELLPICRELEKPENQPKSAVETIDVLGKFEKSGTTLNLSTLRLILTTLGEKMADSEVDQLLRGLQVGSDGEINIVDLVHHIDPPDQA